MTPAEQLAVLTEFVARIPYRPDRRTPEEVARDEWLEGLAEARRDEALAGTTGTESDRAADRYYGMRDAG